MKLLEIIEQLESCGYTCEAGPLEKNVAFQELKRVASYEAPDMETIAIDPGGRYIFQVEPAPPAEHARLKSLLTMLFDGEIPFILVDKGIAIIELDKTS